MLYLACRFEQKFLLGYGKTLVGAHANLFLIIKGPYSKVLPLYAQRAG